VAITYEKRGHVAYITINRPDALNSIDPQTNDELTAAWQDFRDDADLWVGILSGAGEKSFCAGADLKALIPHLTQLARENRLTEFNLGGITRGFSCWKPLIAAINGYALAGGLELALACDLRVSAEHARFGQPEVRWAIIPGAGGTQRLPRMIPQARAMELILTAGQIDAAEALRLGLVNRVVPGPQVMEEAEKLAATLLQMGPLALRLAKRAALDGLDLPLAEGLDLEMELFRQALLSEDAVEGPRAFAEKRTPQYLGR
jgi:E-phenylitaconyl-CoA hydratase